MVTFGSDIAVHAHTLPVIDISPWLHPGTSGRNGGRSSTAAALHAACLDYGFFYLDISSIATEEETEELTSLAHQFFSVNNRQAPGLGSRLVVTSRRKRTNINRAGGSRKR